MNTSPIPITFNRQIVLISRPSGMPTSDNFEVIESSIPEPRDGQILLRHSHLGLAPAARLRMSEGKSYAPPLALGDVVYGQALGIVVESRDAAFQPGEQVVSIHGGWQEYSVARAEALTRVDVSIAPPTVWLGALGTSGMTAYVGLLGIGKPKAGEVVVVSAASGAVGSAVGQIAKIRGCKVVGIAGGARKCSIATEYMQYDACIDYRAEDFATQLQQACPLGVDVYFENVGGASRDAVWPLMNRGGRIVVCGLIAEYNNAKQPGPEWFSVLYKRLTVSGFLMSDHIDQRTDFLRDMGKWIGLGQIKVREHVHEGLTQTVPAFIGMLNGDNFGKTIVRL